jgi:S-adenosylmethionine:tRNA ribosyltransferase-isomerase
MSPAAWPRPEPLADRLLVVDAVRGSFEVGKVGELPAHLAPGDLLVVNDAATLPASLCGRAASGAPVEARLVGRRAGGAWRAVLFGAGDWHTRTEERPPPPALRDGDVVTFGRDLSATVGVTTASASARLVELRFAVEGYGGDEAAMWGAIYALGAPIQYAHVARPLSLWHVQTAYASRPWASELCSAGRPLTWSLLESLRARGVAIAALTHAAGLSSTGDASLDAALPLPEAFDLPQATIDAIARTRGAGGRVVAVGTSVVGARGGAAARGGGALEAGEAETDLVLGPGHARRVVDGLFTGMHERGTSHHALLQAFTPRALLDRALEAAERAGFLGHEFGDSALVLAPRAA